MILHVYTTTLLGMERSKTAPWPPQTSSFDSIDENRESLYFTSKTPANWNHHRWSTRPAATTPCSTEPRPVMMTTCRITTWLASSSLTPSESVWSRNTYLTNLGRRLPALPLKNTYLVNGTLVTSTHGRGHCQRLPAHLYNEAEDVWFNIGSWFMDENG